MYSIGGKSLFGQRIYQEFLMIMRRTMRLFDLTQMHLSGLGNTHPDSRHYKDLYLLRYKAVWSVESRLMFERNTSSPPSGSKNKPNMKAAWGHMVT